MLILCEEKDKEYLYVCIYIYLEDFQSCTSWSNVIVALALYFAGSWSRFEL
jgi:hypothetical protein